VLALGASDCEALRDGVLAQPVNSLSSLAYLAAGAYVLRRGGPAAPALALGAVGAGSVLYHGPMPPGAQAVHDGSIVALLAAASVVAWRRRSFPRPPALAVVALAAGIVVNLLTRSGAPLCRPDNLVQGHAGWHVLTALAAAVWLGSWRSVEAVTARVDEPVALAVLCPARRPEGQGESGGDDHDADDHRGDLTGAELVGALATEAELVGQPADDGDGGAHDDDHPTDEPAIACIHRLTSSARHPIDRRWSRPLDRAGPSRSRQRW
jgi:hypothetical protein